MAIDIAALSQGLNELKTMTEVKTSTAQAVVDAQNNDDAVKAANAIAQAAADDKLQKATVDDQVSDQMIVKQVNWLIAKLKQDPNAGPDPGEPPHVIHTDPVPVPPPPAPPA